MESATAVPAALSIARLHGEACVCCGAVTLPLYPAGTILADGREWQVVACAAHGASGGTAPIMGAVQ